MRLGTVRLFIIGTFAAALPYIVACGHPPMADAANLNSCLLIPNDKKNFLCSNRFGYQPPLSTPTPNPVTSPSYTTGWIASTLGGGVTNQWMPSQAQGASVNSDGTVYLMGYYDEGGKELSALKNGVVTYGSNSNYLKQFSTYGSAAVASNSSEVVVGMQQGYLASGSNPCTGSGQIKQAYSPPSGYIWNAIYIFSLTLNAPNSTCSTTTGTLGGYGTQGSEILVSTLLGNSNNQGSNTVSRAPAGVGILPSGNILVSDPQNNQVLIINGSNYTNVATIAVTNPGSIYVDQGTGNWWVSTSSLISYLAFRWIATQGYQLAMYNSSGTAVPAGNITLSSSSSIINGMCEDGSGDLVIADSGPDQNFKVWSNPMTSPLQIGTIGTTGGAFASPAGQIGNMRFRAPVGCGFDGSGNFYVAEQPYLNGSEVEAYNGTSSGATKLWGLSTQTYIDGASIDPNNTGVAYTMDASYAYNRNGGLGTEGTWTNVTYDPFLSNSGDDPRSHDITGFPSLRNIAGNTYMFLQNQLGTALSIFKKSGNLWKISALYNLGGFRTGQTAPYWPTSQPSGYNYNWIWTDTSGTGVMASGTFASPPPAPVANTTTNKMFYIDSNANIWKPWIETSGHNTTGYITELPLQGVDSNGNPIYTKASSTYTAFPSGSTIKQLWNIAYDPASDTMYADGFPSDGTPTNDCIGGVGRNLEAYQNWSTFPSVKWSVKLPYNCSGGIYATYSPYRITQAGNYIFAGAINPNVVWVFNKSDGSLLMNGSSAFTMTTNNSNASNTGNLDIGYPIEAYQWGANSYDVFQEEDGKNKVIVFHATLP